MVKIVLGAVGVVLLVLAGGAGGYLLADDDDSDERAVRLPQGWALCSNTERGFAIGFPARWHTDEAPLDTLVAVLALPFTKVRGIYVWPFALDRDPRQLTEEELELLSTFATPREIEGWREFDGYIGYGAGIEPDGDWVFYVAGD